VACIAEMIQSFQDKFFDMSLRTVTKPIFRKINEDIKIQFIKIDEHNFIEEKP
jgi:hypothetical protein